ncbi:MAG: phenylalanine--tRNA ligase subunit alpha [Holosporales bacterium]|nr:phenylalanine--tRNA ligase subunit alpha [Holosporales bacterium]
MSEELENNLDHWMETIAEASSISELEKTKASLLGRSGIITTAFKELAKLPIEEKKNLGEKLNNVKLAVEEAIENRLSKIKESIISDKLKSETLDITLPCISGSFGGSHILTQEMRKVRDYYHSKGFLVLDGPEIEKDFFNFDALNIPKHHPARQSHDTFYVDDFDEMLLRTHTTCVQVRALMNTGFPVRMISMGKTYRNDKLDATHSPMFHQVDGLVVDRCGITMGHLKNELKKFISMFFEVDDVEIRFRPSYFPFTEPGVEVDCRYKKEGGKLRITKDGDDWLELGGAGMVHPNVFKNCGIEGTAQGFAFGLGLERLIMLKTGISDIRNIYDTDVRWLRYFSSLA